MTDSRVGNTNNDDDYSDPRGLIVGVGASAGGLEALRSLFSNMSSRPGMTFIVLQHQAPTEKSLLPQLISQVTPMTVTEATDDERLRPDHVYVCPPQTVLTVDNMRIRLREVESSNERRTPISRFLQSLAEAHGQRSVGVILSGAGSDGTFGLRAISDAGGMTLVQDCKSAQFDGMPRSAIATGVADFELPPEKMPEVLTEHLEYLERLASKAKDDRLGEEILAAIEQIAHAVREVTEHDFASYKSSTLVRRIKRRMQILRTTSVAEYLERLEEDPSEASALCQELLISVTSFFRDREAFAALEDKVIPEIFKDRDMAERVRIWLPGCATGQEAYTIAMLVSEYLDTLADDRRPPRVQIFATDIDESAIQTARAGVYPLREAENLSEERLERFFIRKGDQIQVVSALRDMCLFSVHNVISDPPFSSLDLISCRNMLIYFDSSLQSRVIPVFHYSLNDDGFLFLGSSETITSQKDLFRAVDTRHRIWQRRPEAPRMLATPPKMSRAWRPSRMSRQDRHMPDIFQTMQQVVLEEFSPEAVVVNGEGQILCAAEGARDFLQISGGVFQNNIVKMARSGLRVGLRTALAQVRKTAERVVRDDLSIKTSEGVQPVKLTVAPMPHATQDSELYIVVFETNGRAMRGEASTVRPPNEEAESLIIHLERELSSTRDDLEQTVQELEASNEELKSSNEELLSMNEELQSANEELEVSKEELEAANQALARANADLENLLTSTRLATVFLSDEGNIQRFTPAIERIYHLLDQDIGRPLTHINHRLVEMPPLPDAATLRDRGKPVEHEVRTSDGDYFIRRVLPYATPEGPDEGMVVTFIEVTALKRAEERASRLAVLVESSSEAIIGKNLDGEITAWNKGAEEIYGYSAEQAVGEHISLIVPPELREEFDGIMERVRAGESIEGFETSRVGKNGERVDVWLSISPVTDAQGEVVGGSAIARDVTDLKRAQARLRRRSAELEEAKERADAANQAKSEFLANMSHEIRTPMTAIMGYADVLLAHMDDPDNHQCVETIKRNANYLLEIINDILDLSKIEAGKLDLKLERVPPDALLAEVVSLMQVRAEEKKIPLSLEFDGTLPESIHTDPTRLRQVLINLVGNAIKFTEVGGVTIRTHFDGGETPSLRFEISDTGIGIAERHQEKLFEPFNQVDSSETRQYDGTGLGLTICQRLVGALGGEIAVESAPGEGSIFTVRVPVGPLDDVEMFEPSVGISMTTTPSVHFEGRLDSRVLVVDDRHDIRYLARYFLEQAGATIDTAGNGQEALQKIEAAGEDGAAYDVVVMDMQMPVMDGYQAVRKLRQKGYQMPVLALTAAAMPDDRTRCLEAGCTDYTSKPIDGNDLVEMVAQYTSAVERGPQQGSGASDSVLLVDDNADTCASWSMLLELRDYTVHTAQTGADALEVARQQRPSIVVLDLGLPDITGFELVGELKEVDGLDEATFIALSGRKEREAIDRAKAAGFEHYLVKPASPDELLALFPGKKEAQPVLDG